MVSDSCLGAFVHKPLHRPCLLLASQGSEHEQSGKMKGLQMFPQRKIETLPKIRIDQTNGDINSSKEKKQVLVHIICYISTCNACFTIYCTNYILSKYLLKCHLN